MTRPYGHIYINIKFCSRHLFVTQGKLTPVFSVARNRYWKPYLYRHGHWFQIFRFFGYVSRARFDERGRQR